MSPPHLCWPPALLFRLAPAFLVSSGPTEGDLKEGRRRGTTEGPHRARGFFVEVEFTLALILLVGTGLLIHSFGKLFETRSGFRPEHVLIMNVPLPHEEYTRAAQVEVFYVERRDKRVPVVQFWALGDYFRTMGIPLGQVRWFTPEDRTSSHSVIVVSSSMARTFWPGQSAIGKRIC